MKNLYILSTDKPSRLYSYYGILEDLSYGKTFTIVNEDIAKINLHKDLKEYQEKLIKANWKPKNIYITNSEEIKEEDWVYNIVSKTKFKATKQLIDLINDPNVTLTTNKKIILTTDQDLDGVQAIDDEFLKWFVNNSSCEEVEIKKVKDPTDETWYNTIVCRRIYKIIIPKEEPRYNNLNYGGGFTEEDIKRVSDNRRFKQEALEEAACNALGYNYENWINTHSKDISTKLYLEITNWCKGAKWQEERMYSEEDMVEFSKYCFKKSFANKGTDLTIEDLFNQFKKK